jgi:hypothetical protein
MKRFASVVFDSDPTLTARLQPVMGSVGAAAKSGGMEKYVLEVGTDLHRRLIDWLNSEGVDYHESTTARFSKSEILAAKFCHFAGGDYSGYPRPENGYREKCFDIRSACVLCGNGARQIAPLSVKSELLPKKRNWFVLNWEFVHFFRAGLLDEMRAFGMDGFEVWTVRDWRRGDEVSGWRQMAITNGLPPVAPSCVFPRGSSDCVCGRLGRNVPEQFVFLEHQLAKAKAFNLTAEWLGGGATTYRQVIVSNPAVRFLLKHGVALDYLRPVVLA